MAMNDPFSIAHIELDPQSVRAGEYQPEDIYWVQYFSSEEEKHCGLFWKYDLKDFLQKNTPQHQNFFICPHSKDPENTKNWHSIFDEPFFQRRQQNAEAGEVASKLDKMSDIDENRGDDVQAYYLLVQGQKIGPYTLQEIKDQVDQGSILVTDMIGPGSSHQWKHLYEVTEFDRRKWKSEHLPHKPIEKESSAKRLFKKLSPYRKEEVDAIAGLAHQGLTRSSSKKLKDNQETHSPTESHSLKVASLGAFIFTFAAFGLIFWSGPQKPGPTKENLSQKSSPQEISKAQIAKKIQKGASQPEAKPDREPAQVKNASRDEREDYEQREKDSSHSEDYDREAPIQVRDTSRDDRYYGTNPEPEVLEPEPREEFHSVSGRAHHVKKWRRPSDERSREDSRAWGELKEKPKESPEDDYYTDNYPDEYPDEHPEDDPYRYPEDDYKRNPTNDDPYDTESEIFQKGINKFNEREHYPKENVDPYYPEDRPDYPEEGPYDRDRPPEDY